MYPRSEFIQAITEHSAGLADAAESNLDADVQHCPGWTVADLVHHITNVQWFWATVVEERLPTPPDQERRPARADQARLVEIFRATADHLVTVLSAADPTDEVYTWAPTQKDVAFVIRHQVQEVAVHHWDAVNAVGGTLTIAAPIADDAVEEFLTFSVSSMADPADPVRPALAGSFALRSTDTGAAWTIRDDAAPGTVTFSRGAEPDLPGIDASSADLLLWLYQRVEPASEVPADLKARFRALCFTD